MTWMIYGANGYTGELIAREATKRGHQPILAGRNSERIEVLGRELGLETGVFNLDDPGQLSEKLTGCKLVLNCAGPFSATAGSMMEACLAVGAHYLDITGEIAVFEYAQSLDTRAKETGVVLCPGVGFDVIPTDCLAAALKEALPDATYLALGFDSRSGMSPGTAKTTVEGMSQGGKVRRDGKIVTVPLAYEVRHIDFGNGEKLAMTIPWGDVSTAYHTTGIPDIKVFIPGSARMIRNIKLANYIRPALGWRWVQRYLKARIDKSVKGPSEDLRTKNATYVWGEAGNVRGEVKTARIKTENGYSLTVTGSLEVVEYLMRNQPAGGTYTPARLIGKELVTRLPGSTAIEFS